MEHCVLVVRPQAQAASLLNFCQQQGWRAEMFSTMDVTLLPHTREDVQQRLNATDVAFWVSANAIISAHQLRVNPPLHNVCVGQGTLGCFYQYFPQATANAPQDGLDSEAVLRMPLWQDSALRHVTISNGEGGRDWLTYQLLGMGKSVQTISLYQRVEKTVDWEQFRHLSRDCNVVVCVYSREAVDLLFQQVPADLRAKLQSLLYFTIHQRIADELNAMGAGRVLIGKQGHNSVLKLLREHLVSA